MNQSRKISKIVSSVFLLAVLLFPTAIQFIHAFEGHEHITCKDKSTHVHQKVTDCDICDFHFFSSNYDILSYPEFVKATISSKVVVAFTAQFISLLKNNNNALRGPPSFLA
ncbi:hypothetical protein [Cellulophaga sp. L1A9]|uniref:hypothetical protein n=1 Tax=Cellulophaga sp. L1A9 TaxID=2686362 RepID=UPI00131E3802|nr:hypothetical protein [Cellulophaga sp. L1A9]